MFTHNRVQLTVRVLFLSVCVLLAHHSLMIFANAQSATATLSGSVVDQNDAVIAGANITLLNTATSLRRQTTTNDEGSFTVPLLPPGTYTVAALRDGFSPVEVRDVVLNVGDQKALQIQLKAGDVNAAVTVDSRLRQSGQMAVSVRSLIGSSWRICRSTDEVCRLLSNSLRASC